MALPGIDPATGEDARQKAGLGDGRGLRYGQRPAEYPSRMGASGGLPGRRPPGSWRRLGSRGFTVIELVSIMALLGLLSTMGLIIGSNVAQAAKASSTVTQIAYIPRWPTTTSFGLGSFKYLGAAGSPATVSVQGLPSAQASSVAAEVAA